MPFKPNYRLQSADRQRAKEEKRQKKLLRRAERDAREQVNALDALDDAVADSEIGTAESPH